MTTVAVLHHVGSSNRAEVTIRFVIEEQSDAIVLLGLLHRDVDTLRLALGGSTVIVCGTADDTVGESLAVLKEIRTRNIKTLYVSTEKGHLFRAWIISVILHLFTGVTVRKIPNPVDDGYCSPFHRTFIDICRALWHRVTND